MICGTAWGQTLPVGSWGEQLLRTAQITNQSKDSSNMVSRPLGLASLDSSETLRSLVLGNFRLSRSRNIYFGLLPIAWKQQEVTHHPIFANDGAMIPAKGYQTMLSAGLYGRLGPLQVQLNPEFVYAGNPPYKNAPFFGGATKGNYRKIFAGQSDAGLHAGPFAVSVSTENLWWGPGVHGSLLMTNQAPGFLHAKLHTTRPFKTPIGSFEFSLIGGILSSDSTRPFDNEWLQYQTHMPADRYLNGYVFSYQPKFIKGLSVGVTRAIQQYKKDVSASSGNFLNKYLPILLKAAKKNNASDDDLMNTDQLASIFFRWQFRKAKAEVYSEFGYNDYKANTRDFVLNLPHAAAYLVGFRKGFVLSDSTLLEIGFEVAQLSESPDRLVRGAGNWYEHGGIFEGYTHQNQVMGSAFASNTQTLQVAFQKGLQRTSFLFQQAQRYPLFQNIYWNDYQLTARHGRLFRQLYLFGQVQIVRSMNYGWEHGQNVTQLLLATGIHYNFN
ncbi:hypothetical protein BUE76_17070 [Cnuella takakiae]|nr:hypothetical protein BUE76_17070 [Cnuella takakiae]